MTIFIYTFSVKNLTKNVETPDLFRKKYFPITEYFFPLNYRHVIFAPSSHNKYAGESFPGIYDAMFDIKNKADQDEAWKEVKRQISIAAFTVQAAAGTLKEVA